MDPQQKERRKKKKSGREGSEWEGGREAVCERERKKEQDVEMAAATQPALGSDW